MNREELKIRRRHKMMYEINKRYFYTGDYSNLEEYHLKNIKILEEYEKNERT